MDWTRISYGKGSDTNKNPENELDGWRPVVKPKNRWQEQ